jgi:hypothetical protein
MILIKVLMALIKTEIIYPKNYKPGKLKSEERKTYGKQPVVVVFKTSERSNAKTKMKNIQK